MDLGKPRRGARRGRVGAGVVLAAAVAAAAAAAPGPAEGTGAGPAPLRDLGKPHKVRLVYFVPTDREPTAHWREKITVVATFVADLYQRSLAGCGHATRGLDFEFDGGGVAVHLVRGRHEARHYNGDPDFGFLRQWTTLLPEVGAALGSPHGNLFVIFAETYDDGPTKFEWRGGVALGARYSATGGVGLFSAWILRDEFCATTVEEQLRLLHDATPIAGRVALGCMRPDSPRFEFIEDGFGAVAHELGHCFGLPHDHRRDGEFIMGNGFRNLRRNYPAAGPPPADAVRFSPENARILARSRLLADDADTADHRPPEVHLDAGGTLRPGATEVRVRGRAEDDGQLAAVLYFAVAQDSVVGGAALTGSRADLDATLSVRPVKGTALEVVVTVVDRGGNLSVAKVKYDVAADAPAAAAPTGAGGGAAR